VVVLLTHGAAISDARGPRGSSTSCRRPAISATLAAATVDWATVAASGQLQFRPVAGAETYVDLGS
jgi:hypothetical protein